MALHTVIKGVHEIYIESKKEDPSVKNCSILLPRVKLPQLSSETLQMHSVKEMGSTSESEDCTSLFEEEDSFPFLGFGQYGEPTVQLPTLTRSSARELGMSTKKVANCTSKEKANEDSDRVHDNLAQGKKRKHPDGKARPQATSKGDTYSECAVDVPAITLSVPEANSHFIATGNMYGDFASADIPVSSADVPITSADIPVSSADVPFTNVDMPDLHLPIKDEIDEDDITIETEDFDYSYNFSERLLSPSSEESINYPSPGNAGTPNSHLNNSHSENQNNSCGECLVSPKAKPNNLTVLTTQLLELNNKNNELDKKLSKLKQAYENKVTKIQQEKKANEKKIKDTLQKIQKWHHDSEGGGYVDSTTTKSASDGHPWHPGCLMFPVFQSPCHAQLPLDLVHPSHHQWFVQGCNVPVSPLKYDNPWDKQKYADKLVQRRSEGLLEAGDTVQMKQVNGSKKWRNVTVVSPWSYLVRDNNGQVYKKSWKQLVRAERKPFVVIPSPSTLLSVRGETDSTLLTSGSGRVIKKRERLNL